MFFQNARFGRVPPGGIDVPRRWHDDGRGSVRGASSVHGGDHRAPLSDRPGTAERADCDDTRRDGTQQIAGAAVVAG